MRLNTFFFVYCYLPLSILLFSIVPSRGRRLTLLGISLLFYYLAEPDYFGMMLISVLVDFALVQGMRLFQKEKNLWELLFLCGLGKNLGVLLFLFFGPFEGYGDLPLGSLFYTLNSLGYLIDLHAGEAEYENSPVDYLLFTSFFSRMYAGPLVRYRELMPQIKKAAPSLSGMSKGVVLFVTGLAKGVILAGTLLPIYSSLSGLESYEHTILSVWALVICLTFGLFFLLSAYSDMARGISCLFSIDLPKNFYYPYQARTVTEFLQRFNITVYNFLERYVQLKPRGKPFDRFLPPINILLTGALMGLWFGPTWNLLCWGLTFGGIILLERYLYGRLLPFIPSVFRRIGTFFLVLFSFAIFAGDDLTQTAFYLRTMLGDTNLPLYNDSILYLLSSNYLLLILSFLLCTSIIERTESWVEKRYPQLVDILKAIFNLGLLIVVTAFMVN